MKRRIRFFFALVALTVGLGAGAAYAFFTSSGSGHGSAAAGTMQTVTISASAGSPSTPLHPGGTGDAALKVTNPNNFPVALVNVTGDGAIAPDAGHSSCTTTGVTFTNQSGLNISIPANASSYTIDLPGASSMNTASSNGCQGATFSIPVTITVHSS